MRFVFQTFLAIALPTDVMVVQAKPPEAKAEGEMIVGARFGAPTEAVFKGVPYAAPPLGSLRWRPPERHSPRSGTQSARDFGAVCVQTDRLTLWSKSIAQAFGTADKVPAEPLTVSEDCLYLNIWTTSWGVKSAAQPVMVWIHGGSNLNGAGSSPLYDGAALARRGVVVVTINYRLGVFGFMAHPALTAESPNHSSGNYGLLDQIEALRWVQRNIKAFGGDPTRVTAFGESAGAIDIIGLMASPLSKGLFHRVIAESGPPMGAVQTLSDAEEAGKRVSKALGADAGADPLRALRDRPAAELLATADRLLLAGQYSNGPIIDGWVLTAVPGRVFDSGRALPVPLLIGSNALEMTSLRFYMPRFERTVEGYQGWLKQFGPAAGKIGELYPATGPAAVEPASLRLMTDLTFTCPSRFAARAVAKAGHPVYLYQFTRVLPGGESMGAYHAAELGYVFGTKLVWLPREKVDDELTTIMGQYWTQFAATGDPNRSGLPTWPAYSVTRDEHQELGSRVMSGTGLNREACDVVDQGLRAQWGKEQ